MFFLESNTVLAQNNCEVFYTDLETYRIKHPNEESSQNLSLIGLIREEIILEDTSNKKKMRDLFQFDCDSSSQLLCTEISEAIRPAISQNKIVIINESHNLPQSRATAYGLVDFLKENGYHDIFMETLCWNDTLGEKYQIPNRNTGYYSNEVVYGDLIRKLFSSKVKMHPYEISFYYKIDTASINGKLMFVSKNYPAWIPIETDTFLLEGFYSEYSNRDVVQALFIYQKVLQDKIGKYIVYCGYGHGGKGKGHNMGNTLRYLTKDKAITIDQTVFRERSSSQYDYDIYTKYSHFDHPMIISKADKTAFREVKDGTNMIPKEPKAHYDYYILSPRTIYTNNRPDWQRLGNVKQNYGLFSFVDRKSLPHDYLVLAYYQDEYDKIGDCAVPADVIQVLDGAKDYDLVLAPHKKYYLKIIKGDKNIIDKVITIV